MPEVAVVIPSWNSLADLPACVESVRGQAGVDVELLVVDSGSTDGTSDYLATENVPCLELGRNLGFAVAVNRGVERTEAPSVFVLNADTVVEPGCIATLEAALAGEPRLGGVQPMILQLETARRRDPDDPAARVYSLGQELTVDGRALERAAGLPRSRSPIERGEVFGVCGAAALLRRAAMADVGGYDESYFAFYEDVDLNVRARVAGWRFELVPEAVVWHRGAASWNEGFARPAADNARLVARNRLATQAKFMPAASIPRIAAVEVAALARAAGQRRLRATAAGKLAALRRARVLAAQRRELRRRGDLERARAWLGRRSG